MEWIQVEKIDLTFRRHDLAQRTTVCVLAITLGSVAVLGGCGGSSYTAPPPPPPPPVPNIISIVPLASAVGTPVTITGTNFGSIQGTSTLTFHGVAAAPTNWTATSIVAPIPAAATTGNVVVTVNGLASPGAAFTVLPTPDIGSLLPPTAAIGAPITITGANFGATQGASTVTFNGMVVSPTNWSANSISVVVPVGTTTGNVVVTVNAVPSPGSLFTVVPVSVSPRAAAVAVTAQTQQFTAWVGSGGTVAWSVDGVAGGSTAVGQIDPTGLYTPPSAPGTHTVTASSVANPADSASSSIGVTDLPGVFTYHNNLSRDGTNTQEYALTTSSVNPTSFGKLFSCPVDGASYTQPLWVRALNIGGGIHNVVLVATQHDSVFAFDADANPCVQYWQVNLLDASHGGSAGEGPVPFMLNGSYPVGQGFGDIQPEIGVTGTPVIDPASNTIYVVSKSEYTATSTFYQRLHALDLLTGSEKFNAPILIAASVPGIGDGSSGGILDFDPQNEHQRSGLALAGGVVYVSWAAHEDKTPYHGWIIGYSAANVQNQISVYNTTPNGGLGGIWSGGGAPAVDSGGAIYVSTGNGIFDANSTTVPNTDFGDSILRIDSSAGLTLTDWFTPDDQQILSNNDTDVGSGAVVLLPDQTAGSLPQHLLAEVGKEGVVYLIDRDNMGHFQANNNNQIVQSFNGSGLWGSPAFWQNGLYFAGAGDNLKQFTFDISTGLFNPTPSQSMEVFNYPGASPSVSSHGASNGIVWAIDASQYGPPAPGPGPAVLYAYDAGNVTIEYWNSSMVADLRDQAGPAVKFVPPTIANGRVYVSTRTEIDVYGLLP